ncbi:HNH endonuclease [Haloarcula nitratireducens]|uniref:HNH endonuclease n=1 Tax=Haloarcula nitratireducens TaxID=2487749 RepID=A0AAW4PGG2_9EURY|nr:HNH endonuclease [Halomicroarcula nitratireducens]MBX0297069.1 HNH endonuclease [Halomicroarcula nitratireducens]
MTNDRRMTTDRFYGGVTNRLDNLRACLAYIHENSPTRENLTQWVIDNTRASSPEAIDHHLAFLDAIDLIQLDTTACELAYYGEQWLDDQDRATLYAALSEGVKGFDTLLQALAEEPRTDTDLMDILVSEFEEAKMTKPGPAIRHREWLQVLGYAKREGDTTYLTDAGRDALGEQYTGVYHATHSPPPGVEIGDQLTQADIETIFDTGFGYQISGINPRRDASDNQYLLVFATEDGPYNDTVTQGQFKYIGEGLEGDQSTNSPGNSVLIDAIETDIPVHFFYQATDATGWAYQGLVDVLEWEFEPRDGREVLVFTMAHQESTRSEWTTAVREQLQQYHDLHNSERVTLDEIYDFVADDLTQQFPDNDDVRAKIHQQLQILRDQGDVELLDDARTYRLTFEPDVETVETELQAKLETEPQLTSDNEEFTEQKHRVRDQAFARLVKAAYDNRCAICDRRRETPAGTPEVEAAHIYPKSEQGADDPRNGLALCKLHHWAFDTGWLAISDDYTIVVADAPERDGYHEFKQLEGTPLSLPANEAMVPHRLFLEHHRELWNF